MLNFAGGTDVVNLTSLPTNGVMSLDGLIGNASPTSFAINSQATPKNYAGQTVTIPEPSTGALFLAAAGLLGSRRVGRGTACRRALD